jgi:predicted dienelactone hydrolase
MRAHSNTPGWWVARLGIWVAVVWLTAGTAAAFPVGERHLIAEEPSAAIRDAHNSTQLRVTLWYPAAADANEQPLDIGPPGKPLFKPGAAALDAAFADTRPRAVVLLSHGFGGTARIMAWFGTALARAGYVVIAVDHPGNNGLDPMTVAGAVMFWERPGDLAAALAYARADPSIAPHLDATRLGVAGFSAGGFTS